MVGGVRSMKRFKCVTVHAAKPWMGCVIALVRLESIHAAMKQQHLIGIV